MNGIYVKTVVTTRVCIDGITEHEHATISAKYTIDATIVKNFTRRNCKETM